MEDGLVHHVMIAGNFATVVLILVVMEDGLVLFNMITYIVYLWKVLILVVMEDGLVLDLIRPY